MLERHVQWFFHRFDPQQNEKDSFNIIDGSEGKIKVQKQIRLQDLKVYLPSYLITELRIYFVGSGCGIVVKVVASDIRGPSFESSHRQFFKRTFIYYFEKGERKRGSKWSIQNESILQRNCVFYICNLVSLTAIQPLWQMHFSCQGVKLRNKYLGLNLSFYKRDTLHHIFTSEMTCREWWHCK